MALVDFKPEAIGSTTTGNTASLIVTVTPSSSDVLPLREQIILIQSADVDVTMVDDAGTGTYVQGSAATTDGTVISTGY